MGYPWLGVDWPGLKSPVLDLKQKKYSFAEYLWVFVGRM